jgi:GNAT superfamily N-acetyltransferase
MRLSVLKNSAFDTAPILADLWNEASCPGLAVTEQLVRFNLRPAAGIRAATCLAENEGRAVGFISTSVTRKPVDGLELHCGWIDAMAVTPDACGRGTGASLLDWAEAWCFQRGASSVRFGGGPRSYAPGLPVLLDKAPYFLERGFVPRREQSQLWDLSRSLETYSTPGWIKQPALHVRQVQAEEAPKLAAFISREFPGRWWYDFQEHRREGGCLSDYLVLIVGGEVTGSCKLTLPNSLTPLERFFPHDLPRPWGHVGQVGIRAGCRGQGLGSAMLDAGLRFLKDLGTAGCLIDWVGSPDFYRKFGFKRHNEYVVLIKERV